MEKQICAEENKFDRAHFKDTSQQYNTQRTELESAREKKEKLSSQQLEARH